MATLGAMGILIEQATAEFRATAEAEKRQLASKEEALAVNHQAGITHHYKSTRTHSDTFEINAEDGASADDKLKAQAKVQEERNSRCGCFGRLFAKKR